MLARKFPGRATGGLPGLSGQVRPSRRSGTSRAVCFGPSRTSPRRSSHYRDLPGCVMGPEPSRKVAFGQDSHSDLSVVFSLGHLRYLPRLSSGESPWDALGLGPVSTTCGPWPRRTDPPVLWPGGARILPLALHSARFTGIVSRWGTLLCSSCRLVLCGTG